MSGEEMSELKMRVGDMDKTLTEVKTLVAMRDSKWEELGKKVDEIYDFLIGSTDAYKPSMNTRLDRLEQVRDNFKWVLVAVGGLVINAAYEWIKKR